MEVEEEGRGDCLTFAWQNYLQNLCLNSGDSLSQEEEEELCQDFL